MKRTTLSLVLVLLVALPLSASQFVNLPFDEVARGAKLIVRAQVVDTWSAWDDSREVIYTYATLRVTRYFGETTGPDTLVVREVGGSVDGYTQEAIGFPELRRGERVVLMLAEEGADFRIHAYNQGKFLIQHRDGVEMLVSDPVKQGEQRHERRFSIADNAADAGPALTLDEFERMVEDARAGVTDRAPLRQQQQ
ncbi:MAG TPA: hypothetical protein VGF28_04520 [Thermoanaerobaculia bacterium]|jgi:hypothetical protein